MKNLLIIDTATSPGSICLNANETVIQYFIEEKNQTKEITPLIKKILTEAGLELKDLDGVAACIGPGAFTGTRVGVMTAKTLGYSLGLKIIPFSTFDIFEEHSKPCIIDAKCRQYYLYIDGEISIISLDRLKEMKEELFYIEDNLDKLGVQNLKKIKKNIPKAIPNILKKQSISYEEVEVYYPKDR